jgi:hypothetical protein
VQRLIDTLVALLSEEPWKTWPTARGGPEVVWERPRHLRVSAEANALQQQVLIRGSDWKANADEMGVSRSTYFRRLEKMLEDVARILSTW